MSEEEYKIREEYEQKLNDKDYELSKKEKIIEALKEDLENAINEAKDKGFNIPTMDKDDYVANRNYGSYTAYSYTYEKLEELEQKYE